MSYVVDMRETANGRLGDDNLKGERRWERHVVAALLAAGRRTQSSHSNWTRPTSPHWGGVTDDLTGKIFLAEADPEHVRFRGRPRVFISDAFSHMTPGCEHEIRNAMQAIGRERVFLTHSFRAHVPQKFLSPDLHDRIRWLPVPAVPNVYWSHDSWSQKTLLWSGRAIHLYLMNALPPVLDLLDWIRARMLEDQELKFEILLGEERVDQAKADWWVWRFAEFERVFKDLRSRVIIHTSRSWQEVQQAYARTKLCVNAAMKFGGPPIEAAAFGIPVACTASVSVFHGADPDAKDPSQTAYPSFPEMVSVDAGGGETTMDYLGGRRLVDQLDVWFKNGVEYYHAGNAYRKFVDETYTYAAFLKRLDALLSEAA